ncbi:hypothetical protein GCM10007923_33920 [Shinella yambaruensis]|uniref:Uncharacterized protein n=1 Tax=Shinella yambaruensis TaxID=415996 RepID=A0ABQ5ZN94_9HYPH|nr:hypothetical protein GCM10007923_33920 [Shinella yambaruensis]
MAVQVRELIGLMVDQDEDRIFRTKKRSKAITKGHEDILCCRFVWDWSGNRQAPDAALPAKRTLSSRIMMR